MSERRVLMISGQHFATQPRRVDLHFIAEALHRRGIRVDFLSMRISHLSKLIGDDRYEFARTRRLGRWTTVHPLQDEFVWFNLIHPVNLKIPLLNRLSAPLFRLYGRLLPRAVKKRLAGYSDIVIESGMALLLLPQIRRCAPKANIIYHAADRLATIGSHPLANCILHDRSEEIALFHLMAEGLRDDLPQHRPTLFLPHGLAKDVFDRACRSPYVTQRNAVAVGDMLFDAHAVEVMARGAPDWTFNLFGRLARLDCDLPNVIAHGERPFDDIAGYIRFADIGIAPYLAQRGAEYISQSSMKMIQYTYARLPIVAPDFASAGRDHVLAYDPDDDESIRAAFDRATRFERGSIDASAVLTWDEKSAILFP